MASTTKIMTALLVLEKSDHDCILVVKQAYINYVLAIMPVMQGCLLVTG
jgi:D-alanyl-D-alanine carboxypeptidase